MINGDLVHPQLLRALAGAGHGATVLLADGHYPASTAVGPRAEVVHLNLTPGLLDTTTVLRVLLRAVPVEAAAVMVPPPGEDEPAAVAAHVADLALHATPSPTSCGPLYARPGCYARTLPSEPTPVTRGAPYLPSEASYLTGQLERLEELNAALSRPDV